LWPTGFVDAATAARIVVTIVEIAATTAADVSRL
jgi:hypothetical protein